MTSQNKTVPTNKSVAEYINALTDESKKQDSMTLIQIMETVSDHEATMWGPTIIGFGTYHYKYESGREGDMCVIGFSPRKNDLSIYFVDGLSNYESELKQLGKHRTGKSCLYIKRLADIDVKVLTTMLKKSYAYTSTHNGHMHRAT